MLKASIGPLALFFSSCAGSHLQRQKSKSWPWCPASATGPSLLHLCLSFPVSLLAALSSLSCLLLSHTPLTCLSLLPDDWALHPPLEGLPSRAMPRLVTLFLDPCLVCLLDKFYLWHIPLPLPLPLPHSSRSPEASQLLNLSHLPQGKL